MLLMCILTCSANLGSPSQVTHEQLQSIAECQLCVPKNRVLIMLLLLSHTWSKKPCSQGSMGVECLQSAFVVLSHVCGLHALQHLDDMNKDVMHSNSFLASAADRVVISMSACRQRQPTRQYPS